jgi:hypothetical protein
MFTGGDFPYPSRDESSRLAARASLLALRRSNWLFCLLLGGLYWWMMRAWRAAVPAMPQHSLWETIRIIELPHFFVWSTGIPLVLGVAACVLLAVIGNPRRNRLRTSFWGLANGMVHVIAAGLLIWWGSHHEWRMTVFVLYALVGGGLVGGTLLGVYFAVSDRLFGWHQNDVFAVQSIIDYRNFVRMHLEADGSRLTLFPVGLRRVPRKWRSRLKRRDSDPFYEPVDDVVSPHLIEGPVVIPRLR